MTLSGLQLRAATYQSKKVRMFIIFKIQTIRAVRLTKPEEIW